MNETEVSVGLDTNTGVEEPIPAESVETAVNDEPTVDTPTEGETTEVEPEVEQKVDVNAIAASIRRKAEAEAKARQDKVDEEYARRFGAYKNPITGQPIKSQADYLAALDAQEQMKRENDLRSKGVDPSMINQMVEQLVNNSPVVREANEYMAKVREDEVKRRIDADVAQITALDPSVTSLDKVPKEVVEMCTRISGLSLVDAYKICNYGKVDANKADAIRQQAVNQMKGKSHLTPMNGSATNGSTEVEIPSNELQVWKDLFPNKTAAELRTIYNKQL